MIVRDLAQAETTDRRVVSDNWESVRLLLRGDGLGFSLHMTTIHAGTRTHIWYKNHLEAVYCVEGEGEVRVLDDASGEEIGVYTITPGVMYALDRNDRHFLCAKTRMRLLCVFNPALHGKEVHDADGVYPLEAEEISKA